MNYSSIDDDCVVCYNDIHIDCDCECKDCNGKICSTCCSKKFHLISEWLSVPIQCDVCNDWVCTNCIKFCYDCANEGNDMKFYCKKHYKSHSDIQYIECEYHKWSTCDQHNGLQRCGECRTNENYAMKHSI